MFKLTLNLFSRYDGITARGCGWMSPEETVVDFYNMMLVVYILM